MTRKNSKKVVLSKFKTTHWDGSVEFDSNLRTISHLPECDLEYRCGSWNLLHGDRYVRCFATLKDAREFLTDLVNWNVSKEYEYLYRTLGVKPI